MTQKPRSALRIDATEGTIDAKIIEFVKTNPVVTPREAVLLALRAFYSPYVLNDSRLAEQAIELLEIRILQLRQTFLSAAPSSPALILEKPALSSVPPAQNQSALYAAMLDDF